jgi:glycosyltransferase involved in cell wall biosynthesis
MQSRSTESIRVLFMVAEYRRISGGQQSLLQLLRRLPEAGVQPLVCFPKEGRCSEAYRKAGIPIIVVRGPKMLTSYGQHLLQRSKFSALWILLTQMLPYSLKVMREMKRRRISILHCNSVRSLLFSGVVPRLCGYQVVWHVRGQLLPFGKAVRRAAETLASSIILVADALREQISVESRHKCRTIYNGIDDQATPADSPPVELPCALEPGRPTIMTVAALTPFKGHHHLLAAMQIINERVPEKKPILLCAGDLFNKRYVDYLRRLIVDYGLDNVHFLGWQPNPFPFYRLADLTVLPTVESEQLQIGDEVIEVRSGEGLPRSILEAMHCGKPVVATAVAGTCEQIIDGETGFLVPPANPKALAQAILKVLEMSPEARRRMGEQAVARVREKFSTERMVVQTVDLYRDIAGLEKPHAIPLAVVAEH